MSVPADARRVVALSDSALSSCRRLALYPINRSLAAQAMRGTAVLFHDVGDGKGKGRDRYGRALLWSRMLPGCLWGNIGFWVWAMYAVGGMWGCRAFYLNRPRSSARQSKGMIQHLEESQCEERQ